MFRRSLHFTLLSICSASLWCSSALACPMCKVALENDDLLPRAYMYSILFMLGMIGGVISGVIGLLYWLSKTEQAALDAAGYQHLFENGVTEAASTR